MSNRSLWACLWLLAALTVGAWLPERSLAQTGPIAQCAEGMQLLAEGRTTEALPLLEAGFAGRDQTTLANPEDLGICAYFLGVLRTTAGDSAQALEPFAVALAVFRASGNQVSESAVLTGIGWVYDSQGRYKEALEVYQQSLSLLREIGDRTDEDFVLTGIGAAYRSLGRYTEALDAYQQALAVVREAGDRAGEGAALNKIGGVYVSLGRYIEAQEVYEQALAIQREMGHQASAGTTLNNIGFLYGSQGRYVEAQQTFQKALAIAREAGDGVSEGTTLNNIGWTYDRQGRYSEALETYRQALAIQQEVGDHTGEIRTLNNIGGLHDSQGRYDEALDSYWQALAIERQMRDRASEGGTLTGIGLVYDSQGRYGEALDAYQQALIVVSEVGDRALMGAVLNNIGLVYHRQGRHPEALETYRQALAIRREVGDREGEDTTLHNLGATYRSQGSYTEALEMYRQALSISREVGDRTGEGLILVNIAVVYAYQADYDEALAALDEALTIAREMSDRLTEATALNNIGGIYNSQGRHAEALEAHQAALAIIREMGNRADEAVPLENIGYSYQQQGQMVEALAYYGHAMAAIEALRAGAGSEAGRTSFTAQYADLYDRAIGLYHKQNYKEESFHTSERGRARAFLDSLTTGYVELSDDAAAELLTREESAYATRQGAQDALARARGAQPSNPALVADLEAQLATAEKEHAAALTAIQARGDQLAALVPGRSGVLTLPEVQALLDDRTTLVSYYVLGDEGSLAFIITKQDFEVVELPDATPEQLRTAITDLSQWLRDNPENPHPLRLRKLYTWLVTPLTDHLHTPRVGIIPHQLLHYVPFAALTDGETYFGQRYALFTLPSASSLRFIQANAIKMPGASALVFGNPETGDPNLTPLGYAESEARSVASLLHASVAIGAEASEARLREGAADAGVVHLAAHGGYNTANPLYSTIYLAPSDQASGDDGRLETHEVYGLDLKAADLVVLSACQSNVGELSAGDELVGLTRAFFFAGTPTVLSSLWSVDDAATEQLMTTFYRYWETGMGKAEALQAAQADVRSDPRWGSPFYWAGFVLSGDPGKPGQGEVFGRVSVLGIRLPVRNLALYAIITMVLMAATAIIVLLVRGDIIDG